MKSFLFTIIFAGFSLATIAQDSTVSKKNKKDWSKVSLANRSKDHFMFQTGYNMWTQAPDSIQTKGLARSVNVYFMMDFPFKSDPRLSVAIGGGIASDHQYFKNSYVDVAGTKANRLGFYNVADTTHFKKYKLNTTYLEAPVEMRFSSNPENPNKTFKAAIGLKFGYLASAGTKGKNLLNYKGNLINAYTEKEKSKKYFSTSRLSLTGRVGYGVFSLYASYQINSFVKDGYGPDIRPMQIGLTISGL